MSTKTFRLNLNRWATMADADLDALARQVCQETAFRVVLNTPVDIGFLRGSWQPSIGEPTVNAAPSADPSGARVFAEIGIVVNGMKAGDFFYMINNANYARYVEFGTSKMTGRHYVERTVRSWRRIVAEVLRDLGHRA